MPDAKKRTDILGSAIVLISVCLVTALLLFVAHQVTAPQIEKQEAQQTEALLLELLPDAEGFSSPGDAELMEGIQDVYWAENGAGYVISASENDFQGRVTVMTAFDKDGMITAMRVLDGQGALTENRTALPAYIDQFTNPGSISGAKVSADAELFSIPAGAGYSERAVISCVNMAILQYKELISRAGNEEPAEEGGN
ncbi:MAG: hypothetical protein IJM08_04935 [Firmicutes bacterium]|nr:hypothetical protein [Bacillota bacterium]